MKKTMGRIGYALLIIIYLGYLEIWKHQIFGWFIAIALFVAVPIIKRKAGVKKVVVNLCLLALLLVNAFISAPPTHQVPVSNEKNQVMTDVVTVAQGQVQGVYNEDQSVEIFAGIPYAAPPVGELRWKEPQPAQSWDGVRVCDTYAPMAMQKRSNPFYAYGTRIVGYNEVPISLYDNYIEAMSEDCLYVNIWKPADANPGDKLPVLFYIHGGSLNSGQSYFQPYNGESYAKQGIIVVNISYRLGVFGYLADDELAAESSVGTTGNYGLLDQIAALKWVNDNIESFGGDAGNITIAGESAGSSSVNAICVSPLAKGLFRRAIAESSGIVPLVPYHTFRTMKQATDVAANIKEEFGCSTIEELRSIPAEKLVNTAFQNNEMTVDGYAIVEQPYLTYMAGNNNEEVVLGGYNGNEADAFLMFNEMPKLDSYVDFLAPIAGEKSADLAAVWPATSDADAKLKYKELVGVAWFGYSHYRWSELMADNCQPAYLYYFTKQNKSLADWHAGELPYFYGNIPDNHNYDESDVALSSTIQKYILNFVKTGDPNGEGLPQWYTYNEKPQMVMNFDKEVKMVDNQYLDVFNVFDEYMQIRKEE